MPPERFDAVIIGASLEGLACALKLQQLGRKVCVLDRKAELEQLGKPLPAEVSMSALASAGRVLRVATRPPATELAFLSGQARIIWPDPDRTVRAFQATAPSDASRFTRYISQLVRVAALASEPGNINRAILGQASSVGDSDVALKELGSFWARSGHSILDEAFDDPLISGALAMMAAEAAPISLTMSGTAPALIPAALRFCGPSSPVVSIFGGRKALISELAFALREAGGELRLGSEVSEIEVERDVTSGVALSGGAAIKSAVVIAAVAPKRLAQGLISTRRFGFAVSALSAAPRDAEAVADLHLSKVPEWPGLDARLITQCGTIRLGASPETVRHQSEAYASREPPEAVSVAMRFSALEPCHALLSCPMVPAEWTQGGWTPERREHLLRLMMATLEREWPDAAAQVQRVALLEPPEPGERTSAGAIFGSVNRLAEPGRLFADRGEPASQPVKGTYLCQPSALSSDMENGFSLAAALAASGR